MKTSRHIIFFQILDFSSDPTQHVPQNRNENGSHVHLLGQKPHSHGGNEVRSLEPR
jgi:hypothetical protein